MLRWSLVLLLLGLFAVAASAADDLDALQQQAVNAAVDRAAPAVVAIETIGGLERIEKAGGGGPGPQKPQKILIGTGPTTGLVVDPQGYIISSAFNFISKPASILVRLPGGGRKPAKLIATDHSRQLVLLKVETDRPLPMPEVAPESELRIGQWCIALGRTFEAERPSLSVGILSAVGRIFGKALQTDAAVSPGNYGGPLVDIRGRVLGVLVPLSPQSADEIAGMEWYDSGIGFAVPAEHILKILPKLKQGKDLDAGVAGFNMQSKNQITGDTVIAACRVNSPAAKAGFRSNDRIVEIDGRKVSRSAEVKQELARRYAGEKVTVAVMRGQERVQAELELVAKLEPWQTPLLGILPLRGAGKAALTARYVYPNGPAAAAGIKPGDVLLKLAGKALATRDDLLQQIASLAPGQSVDIQWSRGGQEQSGKIKLAVLADEPPAADLPPGHGEIVPVATPAKTGIIPLKVAEFKNEVLAYVPEHYDPAVPHGLVIWLHGSGGVDQQALIAQWKPLCDRNDLILVVPKSAESAGWKPEEVGLVEKLAQAVRGGYTVDPNRVVVGGSQTGGTLTYLLAFRSRDLVRGAAVFDAVPPPMMAGLPENEPQHRLAFYVATAEKSPQAAMAGQLAKALAEAKFPVAVKKRGTQAPQLVPAEIADLARWIDTLDRF